MKIVDVKRNTVDLDGFEMGSDFWDKHVEPFVEPFVKAAATVVLDWCIKEAGVRCFWPREWGEHDGIGGEQRHPLTVYVEFPGLSNNDWSDNSLYCEFNLREELQDSINDCAKNGSWSEGLVAIRKELLVLCEEIDSAVRSGIENTE